MALISLNREEMSSGCSEKTGFLSPVSGSFALDNNSDSIGRISNGVMAMTVEIVERWRDRLDLLNLSCSAEKKKKIGTAKNCIDRWVTGAFEHCRRTGISPKQRRVTARGRQLLVRESFPFVVLVTECMCCSMDRRGYKPRTDNYLNFKLRHF